MRARTQLITEKEKVFWVALKMWLKNRVNLVIEKCFAFIACFYAINFELINDINL